MLMVPMVAMSEMADGAPEVSKDSVTIYFYPNGGEGGPGSATFSYQTPVDTMYLCGTVPTDVPTREGYIFLGWSVYNDGTADFQPGDSLVVSDRIEVSSDSSVYAIWEPESATQSELMFLSDPTTDGTITYGN